ncbi:bifunctional diaminohydroxyphosphoribosylaminopyrimidine deaminase/5-amino-6-(5-phosphoribosylamino)uracil reductase RibD [Falsibacillus pallidus]|uniref:Riboflavin biosynthesis protein RibD n=1 Tax=Falsibacillus pallidus TaxID=493781 RepID=A0A370GH46_9BACI|nr:bifunctional diaminohydroxyphosphoribosylaminopyrimidine deaminase/5-amino-6-(5-phosphoribosylamino)uracil reductase RibD [Falsibacillus pallidus]RDI43125.1 diaminohydroxyphosphoribosylaminopyrimidine deaminase [Falsibacillus pallidus]
MLGSEAYMKLAVSMAAQTLGQTSPNPSVGCVIVKDGAVAGMGAHLKAGTEHAEIHALAQVGKNADGADLYVTLEPCSHYGKTPPCAEAIIAAGISRVFIAVLDPNPLVSGKGMEILQKAGIEVNVGLCAEEAWEINRMFFYFIKHKKPFVTVKTALTLDGKSASFTGDSKWITSEEARMDVHESRHLHDAILTGINTVNKDNPLLTARLPRGGRNPIRIILDTSLSIREDANVLTDKNARTIVICAKNASIDKEKWISSQGIQVKRFPSESIHLEELLDWLGELNIISLYVEGGSKIHTSFIRGGLFQELHCYLAPKILGGNQSIPFIGGDSFERMEQSTPIEFSHVERIGPDIKIIAKPLAKVVNTCSQEL